MTNKTRYLTCMVDGFKRVIESFKDEIDPELRSAIAKRLDTELSGCDKLQTLERRKGKVTPTGKLPLHEDRIYKLKAKLMKNHMLLVIQGTTYQIHKPQDFKDTELDVWFDIKITIERYQGKGKHSNRIYGRIHKV